VRATRKLRTGRVTKSERSERMRESERESCGQGWARQGDTHGVHAASARCPHARAAWGCTVCAVPKAQGWHSQHARVGDESDADVGALGLAARDALGQLTTYEHVLAPLEREL
jgi:hypothetical protein